MICPSDCLCVSCHDTDVSGRNGDVIWFDVVHLLGVPQFVTVPV